MCELPERLRSELSLGNRRRSGYGALAMDASPSG
jgi:hypothetical protein